MSRKSWLILVGLVLIVGAVALFWQSKGEKTMAYTVKTGPAVEVVYATGTVEPVQSAILKPETAGRIVALLADDGQAVTAGQVLAKLDAREEEAAVAELQAKKRLNEISLERARALVARKATTQETFDTAESTLKQTEAQLASATEKLAKRSIISPIDGTVLRRDGEVGELVAAGTQMFVVGNLNQLRVELEVDEDDLPRIAIGQNVLLTADAFANQAIPATLSEITPLGDTSNKSYRVRAALAADTVLKVGMTTEANIVVREVKDAILVPAGALKGTKVQLLGLTGRATAQDVEVGIRGAEYAQILSGLKVGDRIAVSATVAAITNSKNGMGPP